MKTTPIETIAAADAATSIKKIGPRLPPLRSYELPIANSCTTAPIDPMPLMTPAASTAPRREPMSIAPAPLISASGP